MALALWVGNNKIDWPEMMKIEIFVENNKIEQFLGNFFGTIKIDTLPGNPESGRTSWKLLSSTTF